MPATDHDIASATKKPCLGEYKDICITLLTGGGAVVLAFITAVTKIILAKMRLSHQNKGKSTDNSDSNTPSEDKSQFSDLSRPERSRRKIPPHKNTRGQKGKGRKSSRSMSRHPTNDNRRKSQRSKKSDSSQENGSDCSDNLFENPKRAKCPSTNNGSKIKTHKSGKITQVQLDSSSGSEIPALSNGENGNAKY